MGSSDLRAVREAAGLSAAQVAGPVGATEAAVLELEAGTASEDGRLLARLELVYRIGASSPIFVNRLLTVPAAAASLAHGLAVGWSTSELLRLVRECLSNAQWLRGHHDRAAFFAEPPSTGDRGWDALLAGVVEDYCLQHGIPVPPWTADAEPTGTLWFVSDNPAFEAWSFAHTPASLKVRGVILDAADLESV